MRLLAVSDRIAVYADDSPRSDAPVDSYRYLDDLLSIRSAHGLVEFLRDHPHGLRFPHKSVSLNIDEETAEAPSGCLKFGRQAIANAAERCNVQYFDALVDFEGHGDMVDAELGIAPGADLHTLAIADLEDMAERISNLLRMAATAYGDEACKALFSFEVPRTRLFSRKDYERCLVIEGDSIQSMLPSRYLGTFLSSGVSDAYKGVGLKPAFEVHSGFSGDIEILTSIDEKEALMGAANIVTAYALSRWLGYFASMPHVQYIHPGKMVLRNASLNNVAEELAKAIMKQRIGICPVCGRPYLAKRMTKDGKPVKKYCTDSCKVTGSNRD